jgi:HEAT repeat protein
MLKRTDTGEAIMAHLSDSEPRVRGAAVRAVGDLRIHDALDDVRKLVADEDMWVRRNVANCLNKIGTKKDIPLLAALGEDKKKAVRTAAQRG